MRCTFEMPALPLGVGLRASAVATMATLATVAMLSGCGGGGGSGDTTGVEPSGISITAMPLSQRVVEGQQVSLSVAATSALPLSYRWQRNGSDIAGATSPTYTTPQLTAAADDAAAYSVVVSNGQETQSASASLRVFSTLDIASPALTVVPANAPDASIDTSFGDAYAYLNPAVTPKGKLFVFLPASGGNPSIYRRIQAAAANNGFHTIGLSYPNADVVALLCQGGGSGCQGPVREETLSGDDISPLVNVNRANSVENRLLKTLRYLDAQFPGDGWGRYIDASGAIAWRLIRVSGHSQGGGLAGYIGTKRSVDRVCTFSSPADFAQGRPADWLRATSLTEPARFYGFGHHRDTIVPWSNLQAIWAALNLNQFGAAAEVDAASAPYAGSHMLGTNLDVPASSSAGAGFHSMTVSDLATPLDADGLPVYRNVWQTACFL